MSSIKSSPSNLREEEQNVQSVKENTLAKIIELAQERNIPYIDQVKSIVEKLQWLPASLQWTVKLLLSDLLKSFPSTDASMTAAIQAVKSK